MTVTAAEPVTLRFTSFAAEAAATGLPDWLRRDLCARSLDFLGNCLAARLEAPVRAVDALAAEWGAAGESTAVGSARRTRAAAAALVNGTAAHCLDADDTHLPSVLHPSSAVLPAALAAAEETGADGTSFLDAAALGIELACRLGMAGFDEERRDSLFLERGLHATAVCGAIGAALAVGLLRRLGPADLASLLGIAASLSSGIAEATRTGGTVKKVHCGWAAHSGVTAAELLRHGLTGPATVIEGRYGLLHAFLGDEARVGRVTDGLGERWETRNVVFRPYPCNHFTHAGIDAALRLRDLGVRPEQVRALTLGVPAQALAMIAEPAAEKATPPNGQLAAFSGPYTVAAALFGGSGLGVSHDDFALDAVTDPARRALAARVRCVPDDAATGAFPYQFLAVLTAELADGRTVTERITDMRGAPGRPLSAPEHRAKFAAGAGRTLPGRSAGRLTDTVLGLRTGASARDLGRALRDLLDDGPAGPGKGTQP
ncbi:MAG TPA: MmgE/PrpD family protein [Trebonia sp.]